MREKNNMKRIEEKKGMMRFEISIFISSVLHFSNVYAVKAQRELRRGPFGFGSASVVPEPRGLIAPDSDPLGSGRPCFVALVPLGGVGATGYEVLASRWALRLSYFVERI
jgi:hypothetical protein